MKNTVIVIAIAYWLEPIPHAILHLGSGGGLGGIVSQTVFASINGFDGIGGGVGIVGVVSTAITTVAAEVLVADSMAVAMILLIAGAYCWTTASRAHGL